MATIDRKAHLRWAPSLALCVLALPAGGCFRHHTIEPGTWRLSIEAGKDSPESKRFNPKPRDVEVTVDWGQEKGTEDIRVQYEAKTETGTGTANRELKGKIQGGDVDLEGYDQDWVLWIKGKINNPRSMNGTAFGRGKINDKVYFAGTWTMVKATPGE